MDALKLFDAAGFKLDAGVLAYQYEIRGETSTVLVFDADTLQAPTVATQTWIGLAKRKAGDAPHLYFDIALRSSDPRDIVALAIADEASSIYAIAGYFPNEDRFFGYEAMAVFNPFGDDTYGDWQGVDQLDWVGNSDGRVLWVTPATEREWAEDYVTWRDTLCEQFLAAAAAPAP